MRKKRKGTKILSYHCKVYENISLLIQKELVDLYNKNFDWKETNAVCENKEKKSFKLREEYNDLTNYRWPTFF